MSLHYPPLEFRNTICKVQGVFCVCTRKTVTNELMNELACIQVMRVRSLSALRTSVVDIYWGYSMSKHSSVKKQKKLAFEGFTCVASKHVVVLHNEIYYFERVDWCFQRNQDEKYVHILIMRFTLTLPSFSSLASIHNHDVSNHSLLAGPLFFVCNTAYGRYYEILNVCRKWKEFTIFCWVNTYCSLNHVKWSQITGDPWCFRLPRWSYC